MHPLFVRVLGAAVLVAIPALVFAQAEISGVVRDTSGAVLPGVTVEAASPALIEKVRTVVADGSGQYRIVDLRPGVYNVTFTLAGFNTVRREALEVTGSGAFTVNADMRVGALEETITVTGNAPVVDVQTTTRQQVLSREVLDKIPSARNYYSLGVLIPSVNSNTTDVGGASGDAMAQLSVHGSRPSSQRITQNGVSTAGLSGSGGFSGNVPNVGAASEVTIDTNAASAELATGGVRINFVPRDGGNTTTGSVFFNIAHEDFLAASNYTDRLKATGLSAPGSIKKNWDFAPGAGGPILRDRLWYYGTARYQGAQSYAAGMFHNKNAFNPASWTYEPDTSRPALSANGDWEQAKMRMTWQANAKNKFAGEWEQQSYCRCPNGISAVVAPEAARDRRFPTQRMLMAEWSAPVTSRLLLEAVALHRNTGWGEVHLQPSGSLDDPASIAAYPQMISVVEQSTGLRYRSAENFNKNYNDNYFYRAAVSYITGSHAAKFGFNNTQGALRDRTYDFQPVNYRFNNGVPNQLTVYATPYVNQAEEDADLGLYVQDRWTLGRVTLMGGLRYDSFKTHFPEIKLGPGPLVPSRNLTFPETENLAWKDITPRSGMSFDVFGNGKTALKVTLNKYLEGQALSTNTLAGTPSPFRTLVLSTTRAWTDANRNFVPDCDLLTPGANGECGALANQNFGNAVPGAQFDPDLLRGWNNRFSNWEFSTSLQHEVLPRVSVDVGFFRRWYANFQVTDNLRVEASDFNSFSMVAPADARLPGGGGYTLSGLVNVSPAKFGQSLEYNSLSKKYGTQTEHWNGVDFTVQMRAVGGVLLTGGVSTGRRTTDNCDIVAKMPEMLLGAQNLTSANNNVWLPGQWCKQTEPFLTQVKGFGSYTIPKIDLQVSGSLQSIPGPIVAANFIVSNATAQSSLGRPLAGGVANITANIVEPGSTYGERLNQVDLRFGKLLRAGGTRTTLALDLYNALNVDTILTQNNNFAAWQRPQSVIQARFAKITVQFDF
ncbi:MAG: carboxypeptidase regulatory-like domain-containing protein [Vicinamibacterales bacterium]